MNHARFQASRKEWYGGIYSGKIVQTFSIRAASSVCFQCPDFLLNFCQLLLDFLAVWSGIEAIVIVIYVTFRYVRRVCKRCYENREQNSFEEVHHARIVENFVIK